MLFRFLLITLYDIGLQCYRILLYLLSIYHKKAKQWVDGRRGIWTTLTIECPPKEDRKRLWVHAASLGEYEQAIPILHQWRERYPSYSIILTFFSPSGYHSQKNSSLVDAVFYLPLDTRVAASRFVDIIQPDIVMFVKYEIWFHYIQALHTRGIPTFLISAQFRSSQFFFRWYGKSALRYVSMFSHIFVQDERSLEVLRTNGIHSCTRSGDTRFDNVWTTLQGKREVEQVRQFIERNKTLSKDNTPPLVIVLGSVWPADEPLYLPSQQATFPRQILWIIAPHEVEETKVDALISRLSNESNLVIRFSHKSISNRVPNVMVVDTIGQLKHIYQYADIAYVGGGVGRGGLHNILEPAVYGAPVMFGTNHHKHWEAKAMIEAGGAVEIESAAAFEKQVRIWCDQSLLLNAATNAKSFVEQNMGGTQRIFDHISRYLDQ